MKIIPRTVLLSIMLATAVLGTSLTGSDTLPIVYSDDYNISFFGLEKTTPFDTAKYGKIDSVLKKRFGKKFYKPSKAISEEELLTVHDKSYLEALRNRFIVARIAENALLAAFPISVIERKLLYPMKLATQGTIDAALLAYENGAWAINLSGGYHHAERETGDGFCFFADIPLAMNALWKKDPNLRILYIDTDAHQGNGVETIFKDKLKEAQQNPGDAQLIIFDVYSDNDYPNEPLYRAWFDIVLLYLFKKIGYHNQSEAIQKRVQDVRPLLQYKYPLQASTARSTNDKVYLEAIDQMVKDLETEYTKAKNNGKPLFIFYNAGTDPFVKDPVAWLGVSKQGLIARDYKIWKFAHDHNIPIVMTLSGGYSHESSAIIADSITTILTQLLGYKIAYSA